MAMTLEVQSQTIFPQPVLSMFRSSYLGLRISREYPYGALLLPAHASP